MKVKLQAGAELDLLTKDELDASLQEFLKRDALGGRRFRRVKGVPGAPNADGSFDPGIQVPTGYVWLVKKTVVTNSSGNGGDVALFINDTNPSALEYPSLTVPAVYTFADREFVMRSGEQLFLNTSGLAANPMIYVTMQVTEVSIENEWKL